MSYLEPAPSAIMRPLLARCNAIDRLSLSLILFIAKLEEKIQKDSGWRDLVGLRGAEQP